MATPAEQVRLLTGLPAGELTDADIATLLEVNGDSVKLAAAQALETVAGGLLDVASDDITLSGSKRAAVLMSRAARLREQAAADEAAADDGFYFDTAGGSVCRPELTERGW
jgi:hypothetical protein